MSLSRYLGILALCLSMLTSPVLIVTYTGAGEGDGIMTDEPVRDYPWNFIKPGSVITIKEGTSFNGSYYFPIPKGATILDSRITISPLPLTDGSDKYMRNVSFNIGKGPREYSFSDRIGGFFTGDWGRLNRTVDRMEGYYGIDLSTGDPHTYTFALPKNATVEQARMRIRSYQRGREFINTSFTGTSGSHFGSVLQVVEHDLGYPMVLIGSPFDTGGKGAVNTVQYNGADFLSSTFASGRAANDRFGSSISELFTVKGSGRYIGIGAPGEQLSKAGTVHLYDVSSVIELESFSGNLSDGSFGAALAVGNLDQDSDPELAVGAPTSLSGRGQVYILDVVGSSGTFSTHTSLKTVVNGDISGTGFGKALSTGDWSGDGTDDLAIVSDGSVSIILGGSEMDIDHTLDPLSDSGLSEISTAVFMPQSSPSLRDDLFIGCPDTGGGKVLIYNGGSPPNPNVDRTIAAPSGRTDFGRSISSFKDMNGDGLLEVAIGAPGPLSSAGWVGLLDVNAPTPVVLRDLIGRKTGNNGDRLGAAIVASWDLRRDGQNDLVIGAPEFKGTTTVGPGRVDVCEYFDLARLPNNAPNIRVNGAEAWSYPGTTMREGEITIDIASALNDELDSKVPFLYTPTDAFVRMDLTFDSIAQRNDESSATFDLNDFDMRYSYKTELLDIEGAFNSYMVTYPDSVEEDGYIHVPFELTSETPGRLLVFSFGIELDLVPSMKSSLTDLYIDEDTEVADLYLPSVITDDRTSSSSLLYNVTTRGTNMSRVKVWIKDHYWLVVKAPGREEFRNWTGDVAINLMATDNTGGKFVSDDIIVHVRPVNDPPAVVQPPPESGRQGVLYRYVFEAVDAESDKANFNVSGPENMTIGGVGNLTWTPSPWQVGRQPYTITLNDGKGSRSYNFSVDVANVNDAPYFETPPPNITGVYLGEVFTYQIKAIDPDRDDYVSYSLDGPFGAVIQSDTGLLTWTPEIFTNEPLMFTVRAFDPLGEKAEMVFYLRILVYDEPPVVITTPIQTLFDSRPWSYVIEVADPNDDVMFIELDSGPEGMTYDNWTQNLSWTPTPQQVGDFNVTIRVRSTRFVLYQNFTLNVKRSTRTWDLRVTSHSDRNTVSGKVKISGTATVVPGPAVQVRLSIDGGVWVNCTYTPADGFWIFEMDTTKLKDGRHTVTVQAFDGFSYSDEVTIELDVKNEKEPFPFLMVLAIFVGVLILCGGAVYLFIFMRKRNLEKIRDEQLKQQREALSVSRKEMDQFLVETGRIDQTKDYTKMEVTSIDAGERSKEIDAIFQPLNIKKEPIDELPTEIPEDILAAAKVDALRMESDAASVDDVPEIEEIEEVELGSPDQ